MLASSNFHCFDEIIKDWPEDVIKKDQIEIFNKHLRPTLYVNKVPEETVDIKTIKNLSNSCKNDKSFCPRYAPIEQIIKHKVNSLKQNKKCANRLGNHSVN